MQYNVLIELVSEIGCRLARAGAETYRIEESVNRIFAAYGIKSTAYSIPNTLIISILGDDETPITRLCRIGSQSTDLDAVECYSNLSRRICAEKPQPEQALEWVQQAESARKFYGFYACLLGNVLAASGFTLFFGGSLRDSLCAAICGLLLGIVTYALRKVNTNTFFQTIAGAFVMALAAYAAAALHLTDNVNTAIIGTLMLLVPGLLFTNALRDIIFGDTNSGINRIVAVVLIAAAIALGTGAAWNVASSLWKISVIAPAPSVSPVLQCTMSIVACSGFVFLFNIHGGGNILCLLGGCGTWAVACLVQYWGGSELLSYFLATIAASVFSEVMARVRKYPAISYLTVSILPMLPGAGIYYAAHAIVSGNMSLAGSYGMRTLAISGSMAAAILLVVTTFRVLHGQLMRRRADLADAVGDEKNA